MMFKILKNIEPDLSHFFRKNEPIAIITSDVWSFLSNQTHIFAADYPTLNIFIPGNLNIFPIRF